MIRRSFGLLLTILVALVAFAAPRLAYADPSTGSIGVVVLGLDSDDADEQADALSGGLRSRVRNSNAWTLVETPQTFGMLAAALRCPTKPLSAECKDKMAAQLKTERYIFGYVTKGPQSGQVTAEVHLYQAGKPDVVARESFADALRDANDDSLRAVALTLLQKLGADLMGKLVVHLGQDYGEVVVDGDKRVPLKKGLAEIELAPGTHSVESAAGGAAQKRNVVVVAGKETSVDLAEVLPPPPAPTTDSSFPTRKVVGGVLAAGSVALLVVAGINGVAWLDDQKKAEDFERRPVRNPSDLPAENRDLSTLCESANDRKLHQSMCGFEEDRVRHSTTFWVTAASGAVLGAAGAYFLLTDGGSGDGDKKKAKTRLAPSVGAGGAGLVLSGSF